MELLKTYNGISQHWNDKDRLKLPSTIDENGTQKYLKKRKFHLTGIHRLSIEGPAVICTDGYHEYWLNGKCHRPSLEGPAICHKNGTYKYYNNGVLDRPSNEGPAVIYEDGTYEYYKNGVLDRPSLDGSGSL